MATAKRMAKTLTALALTAALALAAILVTAPKTAEAKWYKSGGAYYYRYDNGSWARNTWVNYGGVWYYFKSNYKLAVSCWISYAGDYYYIGSNGRVVTNNWVKAGSAYYYMSADGKVVINDFVDYKGATYYMGADGKPLVNQSVVIDDIEYYFGKDGKLASTVSVVSVNESVIFNENGVKVTVKGLDMDYWYGPSLKLLIENNTSKNITVQARNESVNGYMCMGIMSANVSAGKKANTSLMFSTSKLQECGITSIAEIEFCLSIYDADSIGELFESEPIVIRTSIYDRYQQKYDDSGTVVYDAEGIKVVVKGLSDEEPILGPGIIVEVVNSSDKDITIQTRNESVNGFMVNSIFSYDVLSGKRAIGSITFMSSQLEENGISAIEEVELCFALVETGVFGTYFETDPIVITF